VLNKFKEMEQKVANGEEIDDPLCKYFLLVQFSILWSAVYTGQRRGD
jgi:hypothetical protein